MKYSKKQTFLTSIDNGNNCELTDRLPLVK
jgi:hypothetical protein